MSHLVGSLTHFIRFCYSKFLQCNWLIVSQTPHSTAHISAPYCPIGEVLISKLPGTSVVSNTTSPSALLFLVFTLSSPLSRAEQFLPR